MKNMLGNNESLRGLFQGPITDLLVKLNGEDGERVLVELNKFNRRDPCWVPEPTRVEIVEQSPESPLPPVLTSTGNTFADWLTAREEIHKFLTGQKICFRDMFSVTDELLARTDIMPAFRPAGATNRMAIDWKKKLGIEVWEETDVMKYRHAKGPDIPKLCFINRSVRPDESTLGENAKSPNDLIQVELIKGTHWLNLFGYADADNLHFKITGEHLDSETWTWFPEDKLPGGSVAYGGWRAGFGRVRFSWSGAGCCNPRLGARLASSIPLKTS